MNEDSKRNIGGGLPTGASNGDHGEYENTGDQSSQISRFSKKLAPYYFVVSVGLGFVGGLFAIYQKIDSAGKQRDSAIISTIDSRYQLQFYELNQCKETLKDHENRIRDLEFLSVASRRKR